MAKIQPDYSTIDFAEADRRNLRTNVKYHIDSHLGSGCAGDAPGYPTHFIQSVYTNRGDTPPSGPESVIVSPAGIVYDVSHHWGKGGDWDSVSAKREAILRALWRPLPYESERVQLWIKHTYQYFAHCYGDPAMDKKQRNVDGSVIWPVPYYKLPLDPRKQKFHFLTGPKLSFEDLKPAIQQAELTRYRLEKKEILRRAWDICKDPANHLAVLAVQAFYPEHTPDLEYIAHPPKMFQEEWIDIYDHRPAPQECPGHLRVRHGQQDNCRMCGRTEGVKIG